MSKISAITGISCSLWEQFLREVRRRSGQLFLETLAALKRYLLILRETIFDSNEYVVKTKGKWKCRVSSDLRPYGGGRNIDRELGA